MGSKEIVQRKRKKNPAVPVCVYIIREIVTSLYHFLILVVLSPLIIRTLFYFQCHPHEAKNFKIYVFLFKVYTSFCHVVRKTKIKLLFFICLTEMQKGSQTEGRKIVEETALTSIIAA